MKRQRGRGRKPGNSANRSYQSNGPEVKINGNASQIYDKYLQLARDASSAGDRVRAENLYQHAEHYLRVLQLTQPKRDPSQDDDNGGYDGDDDDGYQGNHSERQSRERRDQQERRDRGDRNDRNDRNDQGDNRESRDNRDSRDSREPREPRENREPREPRRGRNPRNRGSSDREPREPQDDPLGVVTPEGDAGSSNNQADAPVESDAGGAEPSRRTRRPRRTKAEMEAARAAEAALKNASASVDEGGSDKTGGDGSETEAA